MNMQTPGVQYQMNSAFFEQNGRSGYVLKPNPMRKADSKFNPFEAGSFDLVVPASLSLTVILRFFWILYFNLLLHLRR